MRAVTLNTGFTLDDFNALLATRQFAMAEAFTVNLVDDNQYYYTDAQQTFTVPPVDGSAMLRTYLADQVLITGFRFKASDGQAQTAGDPTVRMEVDEQQVTFTPFDGCMIDDLPFLTAVASGSLDAATIRRDRWFIDRPGGTAVGGIPMFSGLTASIDRLTRTQAIIKCKSAVVLLNMMMPKNLYQPNCIWTVYDSGCGADRPANTVTGVCGAGSTEVAINWAGAAAGFSIGPLLMEDGANVGETRTVRVANGTQLILAYPLPYAPALC